MNSDTPADELVTEQEARFELRESFLRAMLILKGIPCKVLTYEQSTLDATFGHWNPDGSEVLVTNVKTPANIRIPSAILRTPDIILMQFNDPVLIH